MRTYLEHINESKQIGDVYHFTSFNSMVNILNQNKLKAYKSSSTFLEFKTISTTRDKNYVNSRGFVSLGGDELVFVLDGNKMSTKYKRRPIDDRYDIEQNRVRNLFYGDEQEEIWYGSIIDRDSGIINIKKYIKKILFTKKFINYVNESTPNTVAKYLSIQDIPKNTYWTTITNEMSTQERLEIIANFLTKVYEIPFEVPKISWKLY